MERWRSARGQGTTEYVALVALVAVALALAAGLTSGGVGSHVLAGIQRGLCRVTPLHCPPPQSPRADLAACPLERATDAEEIGFTIAVLRLGTRGVLTATRLSDGRVTVALAHGGAAGGEAGLGARLRISGRSLGGELRARAGAEWTSGRSWTFASEAAARRFVETYGRKATLEGKLLDGVRSRCSILCDALGWDPHEELPPPDETFAESGLSAGLTASLGLDSLRLQGGKLLGQRIARDGSRTWYLQLGTTVSAALGMPGGELMSEAARHTVLSYELDPHGRPRALYATRAGEVRGGVSAAQALGMGRGSIEAGAGVVLHTEATLDLREPAARAAASDLLGALTGGGDLTALARGAQAVAGEIARRGQVDRRAYVSARTATGLGAGVAFGVKADAGVDRTSDRLRLVAAETRLPGLPFLPRDDCRPS